jgi:hypothetical protein
MLDFAQILSMAHYTLQRNHNRLYALCCKYGLAGDLDGATSSGKTAPLTNNGPPVVFAISANRPKLSMKASIAVFAIRALTASWSFLVVLFYLYHSFPDLPEFVYESGNPNIFRTDYLGNIEVDWIRRWKQCALMAPYMLVYALLVVDIACASKIQLCIFALMSAAPIGLAPPLLASAELQSEDAELNFASVMDKMRLLPFFKMLAPPLLTSALLLVALYRHRQQHRVPQTRRIGLLYSQYFGVNGSLFPLKVIVFQAATVILQTLGKLLLLGEIANIFAGEFGHVLYWLFFTLLGLNATIPALLLQVESVYWQRVAVCYLDIFFDLMYTLVFGVGVIGSEFMEAMAPTDALSFGSNLLPLLHILSVARAIEMHGASTNASTKKDDSPNQDRAEDVKGGDATNETTHEQGPASNPLSRKVALGFLVAQVAAMAVIIISHQSLYPFYSDPCAPCTCPSGVLDCRGFQYAQHVREPLDLSYKQLTAISEGAFEGFSSLEELDLSSNQLTTLPEGAFECLALVRMLDLSGNPISCAALGSLPAQLKCYPHY